jgi:hypothetical protein
MASEKHLVSEPPYPDYIRFSFIPFYCASPFMGDFFPICGMTSVLVPSDEHPLFFKPVSHNWLPSAGGTKVQTSLPQI